MKLSEWNGVGGPHEDEPPEYWLGDDECDNEPSEPVGLPDDEAPMMWSRER